MTFNNWWRCHQIDVAWSVWDDNNHIYTVGPNGSKNDKEKFQLYFHFSLVRHGTIANR